MSQTDQLKPGDIVNMEVGGETLVLEPIPYGRLKKLFKIVFSVINEISSMEQKNVMFAIPEIFEKNLPEFCELAFNPKTHKFITEEWIEENLTILHIRQIAETLMAVNGIKDFLGRGGAKQIPVNMVPPASPDMTKATS